MKRPVIVRTLASLAAAALAACGGTGNGSDGGTAADPSSRIGWDQQADTAAEIATFRFVMYADGVRRELPGASCSTSAGPNGFPCSVLLPPLPPGQHLIEIASYVRKASIVFESPKSPAVVITVMGPSSTAVVAGSSPSTSDSAAPDSPPAASGDIATRDGVLLHVDVAAAVDGPSALAAGAGGELFVGDASGTITVIRNGGVEGRSAIEDESGATPGPVLGLALDPDFARNHYVYTVDAVPGEPPAFRLARFREAGGQLGERAVLLADVPASSAPAASIAFGQDARLYVAFDDGGDPDRAAAAASYNGKVLRLNPDGTTPTDRPGTTPVLASELRSPRSMVWDAPGASLWIADLDAAVRLRPARRAIARSTYALPVPAGAASLSIYRAPLIPGLQGNLLVAAGDGSHDLLRLRLTDGDESTISRVERLALPGGPAVRLVHVGADGAVYVGTDREVLRIVPGQ